MQRGQLYQQNHAWWLRFYRDEIVDGQPVRRRVCQRLGDVDDAHRTRTEAWTLANDVIALLNRGGAAEGGLTVNEFAERYFLPFIKAKKKPSTHKFYDDLFENHIRDRVGFIRLRDFTTRHAQEVLDASSALSHPACCESKLD
jgi:hypothetical protein